MPAKVPEQPALKLTVQFPDARLKKKLTGGWIKKVVRAALLAPAELTLRFVNAAEGRTLNGEYRGKDYATNVLTFAYSTGLDAPTVADIVLCTDVLVQEALEQHKSLTDHVAHLIVHGVLHAQGYDHENDQEAEEMEALETDILGMLDIEDPYIAPR